MTDVAGIEYLVLDYGADPSGVKDSTYAFQAALNDLLGTANPATTTRIPKAPLHLPAGRFKITADLLIQSVMGFTLKGAGKELTILEASGTGFSQAVINVDGSAWGTFEGFTILGDGTEQVSDAITLQWSSGAARSTTQNTFRDFTIRDLHCVNGFHAAGHNQVDGTLIIGATISGAQNPGTWSSSGNWQAGILLGDGIEANNFDHYLLGVSASGWNYGLHCMASSFQHWAAEPAGNGIDFWVQGMVSTVTIRGVESEASGQLLKVAFGSSPGPLILDGFRFDCTQMTAPPIQAYGYIGPLLIRSGQLDNQPAGVLPTIQTNGAGNNNLIDIDGLAFLVPAGTTPAQLFTDAGGAEYAIKVRNLYLFDPAADTVAIYQSWGTHDNRPLAAPAVPASGTAQANTHIVAADVYIAGGVVTGIAINGNATGLTGGRFTLNPGDTITLTYTSAPTWTWLGAT